MAASRQWRSGRPLPDSRSLWSSGHSFLPKGWRRLYTRPERPSAGGNEQVIFCERGIRTFEKYTRNTLDLSAVPIIHEKTHLPIVVDPSHATGKANLVEPMMIAAVAAGADGLEVEVHYDPQHAWSDGAQCLTPDAFAQAMAKCRQVAWAIGREM